jgi:hypothetical protein
MHEGAAGLGHAHHLNSIPSAQSLYKNVSNTSLKGPTTALAVSKVANCSVIYKGVGDHTIQRVCRNGFPSPWWKEDLRDRGAE